MNRVVRVLLVEDNYVDVTRVIGFLERADDLTFDVVTVETLATALPKINHRIDIVLLDINLPNGRGLETIVRVQQIAWPFNVPVIVLTGEDDPHIMDEAINRYHVKNYLLKSATNAEILIPAIRRQVLNGLCDEHMDSGKTALDSATRQIDALARQDDVDDGNSSRPESSTGNTLLPLVLSLVVIVSACLLPLAFYTWNRRVPTPPVIHQAAPQSKQHDSSTLAVATRSNLADDGRIPRQP